METLKIERMANSASAVARAASGKTVFVDGAVPGDVAQVEIYKEEKNFARGRVAELLEAGPSRVKSHCVYSEVCGGCPWAHIDIVAQRDFKRQNVVDVLKRLGGFDEAWLEDVVKACAGPADATGYRNKIELAAAFDEKSQKLRFGMMQAESHNIVQVESCPLLPERYKKLPKALAGALGYLSNSGSLEDIYRVGIRASKRTGALELALWCDAKSSINRGRVAKVLMDAAPLSSLVRVLTKGPVKARKVSRVEVLSGKGYWEEKVGNFRMFFSAPSFFQVNTKGAEKLIELVTEGLAIKPGELAMDLFCGAGTFTLPLAEAADYVEAVEASGPAVRDLRRNLELNQLTNVEVTGGDALREFPDLEADVIVVDPPRAGLGKDLVQKLSESTARAIAYVSCDPATLARDLKQFSQLGRYQVKSITPVDLFSQSYHVENVCILERN